jgi:hypothetical protein
MTTIPENQLTAWGLKLIKKFKNFTVHLTETPRPYYKDQPVETVSRQNRRAFQKMYRTLGYTARKNA